MQLKRILRFVRILVLGLAVLFILLLIIINLPYSQRIITAKVNKVFRDKGLPVQVDKISLLVNGKIGLKDLCIAKGRDTIAFAHQIKVDVRLLSLLSGKIKLSISMNDAEFNLFTNDTTGRLNIVTLFVPEDKPEERGKESKKNRDINIKSVSLRQIKINYHDAFHGINLKQYIGKLYLRFSGFSLLQKQINAAYIGLEKIRSEIVISTPLQKTTAKDTVPSIWKLKLKNSDFSEIYMSLDQPEKKQRLEFALASGGIYGAKADIYQSQVLIDILKITRGSFKQHGYDDSNADTDSGKFMSVNDLNTTIKSIRYDPNASGINISNLAFEMGNGLQLKKGQLVFNSDTVSTLHIKLQSQLSQVESDIKARKAISEIVNGPLSSVPLSIDLKKMEIAVLELLAFFPGVKDKFQGSFKSNDKLKLSGLISGSTGSLKFSQFKMSIPAGIEFNANGYITDLTDLRQARGEMNIRTNTISYSRLTEFLKTGGNVIKLPRFDRLMISARIQDRFYAPAINLTISGPSGKIDLAGNLDLVKKYYDMQASVLDLSAGEMFDIKEMQRISGKISVTGNGYNTDSLDAKASVIINSLTYKGHQYNRINFGLTASEGHYRFELFSDDPSLKFSSRGNIIKADSLIQGRISGNFAIKPGNLNLYPDSIEVNGEIMADFQKLRHGVNATASLQNLNITKDEHHRKLKKVFLSWQSLSNQIKAGIDADFIKADLLLLGSLTEITKAIQAQGFKNSLLSDSSYIIKSPVIPAISTLQLSVQSTYDPVIGLIIPDSVFRYGKFSFIMNKDNTGLVKGELRADKYIINHIIGFNTHLNFEDFQDKMNLTANSDSLKIGKVSLGTSALELKTDNSNAGFRLKINNSNEKVLYDIEAEGLKRSNTLHIRSDAPHWILNGYQWTISPGDFIILGPRLKSLTADLHLGNSRSEINLYGNNTGKLNLDLKEVQLNMLMNPEFTSYRFDGKLNGKIDYSNGNPKKLGVGLEILQMKWADRELGHMTLTGKAISDTLHHFEGSIQAIMNDTTRLMLSMNSENSGNAGTMRAEFTRIPIPLAEPFVSKYVTGLKGNVSGSVNIKSQGKNPVMNGKIQLFGAALKIIPLNARFSMPSEEIQLSNNQIIFNQFIVLDSLKKRLYVNGMINLNERQKITTNLKITSDNLLVMNTTAKDNATFNGSVFLNSRLAITGPIQQPSIRGNLALAEGTVVNYQNNENLAVSETQKLITFASFADTFASGNSKANTYAEFSGFPYMEASIEIDPKSIFNFQISHGYDIAVQITGGGYLNYTLLPNKTIKLSGTYEIRQGNTNLKITGWPRKYFNISGGSYLRWNGAIDDPELNIETTSKVKGAYFNPVENKDREVDFVVSMKLSNRLSQLDVVFDVLSADQYIMSVLNSLSRDERMRQSINLLIFERIELPNMSNSPDYVTKQINQFWETQLNRFTKSTFKNVDVSFGVNSYTGESEKGGKKEYTSLTYEVKKDLFQKRGSVTVSGRMNDNSPASAQSDNMIENFTFEYALDTNRSKFLKVYRQHNYEDLLEGEVTKSGVGFIYRKNYDKLKDIWRRKNKKKE